MSTVIIIMAVMFMCVAIGPILQNVYYNRNTEHESYIGYVFEQELLDTDLEEMRIENVDGKSVTMIQMRDRGSVRIAQGLAFDLNAFEKRKKEEYLIELP